MKALITGAGGFVGGHLLKHLRDHVPDVLLHGTLFSESERRPALDSLGLQPHIIDLRDPDAVMDLVAALRPDRVYHLAGQAYVPRSYEDPWETLEINIRGTLNLLEAIRALKLPTRILVVSSAEIYGAAPTRALPLTEAAPFIPSSPYSVSKIGQDMLAWQYARAHSLFTVRTRPFNHIGPGQSLRFAVPDWAQQIAEAERGLREPVVYVGNLEAARDFTDVRDVVRAYVLVLERGAAGEVYNVCQGEAHTMRAILELLVRLSTAPVEIRPAPERMRPTEIPILYGDSSLLRQRTGWEPRYSLEHSLRDVLEEARERVRSQRPSIP